MAFKASGAAQRDNFYPVEFIDQDKPVKILVSA